MEIVYPKKLRFECQRCARCCGDTSHRGRNLLLTKKEVERIAKRTGRSPMSFASPISNNGHYGYKMKKRSGKCVFLVGKACSIYNVRPLVCRFYPLSINKKNKRYVFEVSDDCPGVGLGKTLSAEKLESMVEEAKSILKAN